MFLVDSRKRKRMSNQTRVKPTQLSLASALNYRLSRQAERAEVRDQQSADENVGEFLEIYRNARLTPFYQPIVDVSRAGVYGYEALIRGPSGSNFETPLQLFRAAASLNLDREFEILCRKLAIRRFAELKLGHLLFINISPSLLLPMGAPNGTTMEYLHEYGVDPGKIVIEVTEHCQTRQYEVLNAALDHYRNQGFKVALDDLGSGYSSLRLWTEVLPDFIKIDKHFIHNIHRNRIKQSFIHGLLKISSGSNCRIIAEGVESHEEFDFLSSAGINYQQGFYFARPAAEPPAGIDPSLLNTRTSRHLVAGLTQDNLQSITKCLPPIPAATTVREVLEKLQRNPEVNLLPIVDTDRPAGLVERFVFLNSLMQSLYGIDLYGKMKIIDFLNDDPVTVDIAATLEEASNTVTSAGTTVQAFIVTQNSRYHGVSTVLDLLHKITEQQICSARHANPLTLLPGIVPTNDAIDRLLYSRTTFALAYFDLDNFKPYNDYYGYDAGDIIIKRLAEILRSVYKKEFSLIGHIGGDDFVVVDMSNSAVENCRKVMTCMEDSIADFYRPEHLQAGGINAADRQGNYCLFPLLSISVGLVSNESASRCKAHQEISDLACQAKKLAKQTQGNSLFIDRRVGAPNTQDGCMEPCPEPPCSWKSA